MTESRMGVGDAAETRIKRADHDGWESRYVNRSGVQLFNWADIAIYAPAIFETRHELTDCWGVRVKPGQLARVHKNAYIKFRNEGSVRTMVQPPHLKGGAGGKNLVTTVGVNDILDVYLDGQAAAAPWYVGLTDDTPAPAAGHTMASHAGWTEFTEYSETVRQTWTGGAAAAGSIDNSAAVASFSINNDTNGGLGGVFLVNNNTKGGTPGDLYSCVAITGGNRVVGNGDTVEATYTFTAADDGA